MVLLSRLTLFPLLALDKCFGAALADIHARSVAPVIRAGLSTNHRSEEQLGNDRVVVRMDHSPAPIAREHGVAGHQRAPATVCS